MTRPCLMVMIAVGLFACQTPADETLDDYASVKKICDSALALTDRYIKKDVDSVYGIIDLDAALPSNKTDYDYLKAGRELINATLAKMKNDSLRLLLLSTKMKSCLVELVPDPEYFSESHANMMEEYFALSKKIVSNKYNVLTEGEKKRLNYTYENSYKAHFNIMRLRKAGKGDSIDKAWHAEMEQVKHDTMLQNKIKHDLDSISKQKNNISLKERNSLLGH